MRGDLEKGTKRMNGVRKSVCAVLGVLAIMWLSPIRSANAQDEVVKHSADPLAPPSKTGESIGAKMRHPFHRVRKTWEDYFKVFPGKLEGFQATTAEQIAENPVFYLDRKIQFDLYFSRRGKFFRPFLTPFHRDNFVNFQCWPYGADLWNAEKRVQVLPFLYVSRLDNKLLSKLNSLKRFQPIHVWGELRAVSDNQPWIEVKHLEKIPERKYSVTSLRRIELGFRALDRKDYLLAEESFRALRLGMIPLPGRVKVLAGLGKAESALRRYALAREAFAAAVRLDPGSVENLLRFAHVSLQLEKRLYDATAVPVPAYTVRIPAADSDAVEILREKHLSEALKASAQAVNLEPSNPLARAEYGLALALSGKVREGLAEFEAGERLSLQRRLPEIYRNRALVYARGGNLKAARTELENAVSLRPMELDYHLELGDVRLQAGEAAEAFKEYKTCIQMTALAVPGRPEPFLKSALALKKQAEDAIKEGKKEEAANLDKQVVAALKTGLQRNDRWGPLYVLYVKHLTAMGKRSEAEKVLADGTAAAVGAKSVELENALFEAARLLKDRNGMERAAMAAVLLRPQNGAQHYRLGLVLETKREPDVSGAEGEYAAAVNLAPENARFLAALGRTRLALKKWKAAENVLAKAVRLAPEAYRAWSDLAAVRRHLGDVAGTVAAAQKAFVLKNSSVTRLGLALALLDRGDPEDAEKALCLAKLSAAKKPQSATAQAILGAALNVAGDFAGAKTALGKAYKAFPKDAEYSLWRAEAHFGVGELAVAESAFHKALCLAKADRSGSKLTARVGKAAGAGLKRIKKVVKARAKEALRNSPSEGAKEKARKEVGELESKVKNAANKPPVIESSETTDTVTVSAVE